MVIFNMKLIIGFFIFIFSSYLVKSGFLIIGIIGALFGLYLVLYKK